MANSQNLDSDHLIELGKFYSSYMFMSNPPKTVEKDLGDDFNEDFEGAVAFIKEAAKSNNKLLSDKYLLLPDTVTLKIIYIVDALHQNPHREKPLTPNTLIDSLLNSPTPLFELADEYYSTLFTAVGNKNKPFNMSKVNFSLDEYGLNSDLLKGIFYLRCMDFCGSQIFGYMNIVKPPNTEKAFDYIGKFPKFNHSEYFRYTDLYFEDFEMELFNDKGMQSYKDYYIDKLYSTLLNHLICLDKESKDEGAINELLLGSILKTSTLYKHTSYKETLESIFKKQ